MALAYGICTVYISRIDYRERHLFSKCHIVDSVDDIKTKEVCVSNFPYSRCMYMYSTLMYTYLDLNDANTGKVHIMIFNFQSLRNDKSPKEILKDLGGFLKNVPLSISQVERELMIYEYEVPLKSLNKVQK